MHELLFQLNDNQRDIEVVRECMRTTGHKATLILADGRTLNGFIDVRPIPEPLTMSVLKHDALVEAREWLEAHSEEHCNAEFPLDCQRQNIESSIRDLVPCMTTTLFDLVVHDNALAFAEADLESSEPFAVLASAVERDLMNHVFQTLEAEQEEEQDDADD